MSEAQSDIDVILIDQDGVNVGIVSQSTALKLARKRGLNVVIVEPDASPPVAMIGDYDTLMFEKKQRSRRIGSSGEGDLGGSNPDPSRVPRKPLPIAGSGAISLPLPERKEE